MGLLDGLLGSVLGKVPVGGQQGNALMDMAMGLLNNPQSGGLSGLLEKLKASGGLAQLLPTLIDKLTPNGAVPANGDQLAQGLAGLRKLLG